MVLCLHVCTVVRNLVEMHNSGYVNYLWAYMGTVYISKGKHMLPVTCWFHHECMKIFPWAVGGIDYCIYGGLTSDDAAYSLTLELWHGRSNLWGRILYMLLPTSDLLLTVRIADWHRKKRKINYHLEPRTWAWRLGVQYTKHQAITPDKIYLPILFLCTTSGCWLICQPHTDRPL